MGIKAQLYSSTKKRHLSYSDWSHPARAQTPLSHGLAQQGARVSSLLQHLASYTRQMRGVSWVPAFIVSSSSYSTSALLLYEWTNLYTSAHANPHKPFGKGTLTGWYHAHLIQIQQFCLRFCDTLGLALETPLLHLQIGVTANKQRVKHNLHGASSGVSIPDLINLEPWRGLRTGSVFKTATVLCSSLYSRQITNHRKYLFT